MTGRLRIQTHETRLELVSSHEGFLATARSYLASLLDESEAASDIRVILEWNTVFPADMGKDLTQLGRRIWVGAQCVYHAGIWQVPGLQMNVQWQDGVLVVHAAYHWPTRREKWLSVAVASVRHRLFASLVYYLVYFPYAWWLERERGWTLLHASAIASTEGALVFSGLPGCGKSTTALAALGSRQWQVVSDNLLFTDGKQVFACFEPIHVDPAARALVGDLGDRIHYTGRPFSHQRRDYELTSQARRSSAPSLALGFLHVGKETAVRPVDRADAARRLMANDYLAKEWMAYQESAAAMHQVWPRLGDQTQRSRNLTSLARSVPCYDVAIGRGMCLQREIEHVIRMMLNGNL